MSGETVKRELRESELALILLLLLISPICGREIVPSFKDEPYPGVGSYEAPPAVSTEEGGRNALGEWVFRFLEGQEEELLRIKMLHDWVSLHITYDTEALFSGRVPPQDTASVLRKKRAVCEGYARLFQALVTASGAECVIIRGEVRLPLRKEKRETLSHAWNAVKIRNEWYLVDTTWDAGFLSGEGYKPRYSTAYLFIPAHEMISTHLPEDPVWQLLENRVTRDEFFRRPLLTGPYFDYFDRSSLEELREGTGVSNPFILDFIPKKKVRLTARIHKGGEFFPGELAWVDEEEGKLSLTLLFPESGVFDLLLFAGDPGEARMELAGEISLRVAEGVSYTFPVAYRDFNEHQGRLLLPRPGPLKQGEYVTFRFLLPSYAKAAFLAHEEMIPLAPEGNGIFSLGLRLPRVEELTLYGAENEEAGSWDGLLKFSLEKQ